MWCYGVTVVQPSFVHLLLFPLPSSPLPLPPFLFISAPPPPSSQLLPALSAHFNSFIYLLCHCLHLCQCHHPPYRAVTTHIHMCCHCPCIVCCHHSMLLSLYPALPLSVDHCHHCCCCCPPVTVAFCSCLWCLHLQLPLYTIVAKMHRYTEMDRNWGDEWPLEKRKPNVIHFAIIHCCYPSIHDFCYCCRPDHTHITVTFHVSLIVAAVLLLTVPILCCRHPLPMSLSCHCCRSVLLLPFSLLLYPIPLPPSVTTAASAIKILFHDSMYAVYITFTTHIWNLSLKLTKR